ncbi:hypothetical protein KEM55_003110 [Ascosphaera atra]|nr:hypothetical protein KEM55_003110 [Ascosphaera atra]
MQIKRLFSLLTIAGSLPLSLALAAPGPGTQDVSYETSLAPRDLVKRLSIEKWATRCWGFDLANLANFNPLHLGNDIQDFLTSLVPIMSSPCFPVAATVLKCSFKDDIIPFLLGGRPEFQNPSEEAECYCEDKDFPEVVTK